MIEKSYTDEEIAEIVRKHGLPRYPKLALYREKLSRKAKAEPNFRFYCFRYVRGIHRTWYGTEDKWLWFGPSMKSVKKVCAKVKELTLGRMNRIPIRDTIQKLNVILKGWSNYFNGGYPNPRYLRVNDYVRNRLIILSRHTSQRGYKLKYAQSYYYEWKAMGLYEMRKRRAS